MGRTMKSIIMIDVMMYLILSLGPWVYKTYIYKGWL